MFVTFSMISLALINEKAVIKSIGNACPGKLKCSTKITQTTTIVSSAIHIQSLFHFSNPHLEIMKKRR